jgi:hypothetical protein
MEKTEGSYTVSMSAGVSWSKPTPEVPYSAGGAGMSLRCKPRFAALDPEVDCLVGVVGEDGLLALGGGLSDGV